MSKKIIFKIDQDGNVCVENAEGYGASCLEATKFLEQALGSPDEFSRKLTADYEKPVTQTTDERITH